MKDVKLYEHNEEAYNKLIECLKNNNYVSVNHATGTGKSFIILKYLYNNKDKKILYLAPTYPIIDQLLNNHMHDLGINQKEFKCIDNEIYSNLSKYNTQNIVDKYDIIILDEYHRCGAPKWGKKVNEILEALKKGNKNTKVIGTTATEIRYLDNYKNMNNILFDGVEASRLTLADAIVDGILPTFQYTNTSLNLIYRVDNLLKKIDKYLLYEAITINEKNELLRIKNYLENKIKTNYNISNELPSNGKYLVFSSKKNDIAKDMKLINSIFNDKMKKEYVVTSDYEKKENEKSINEFRSNNKNNFSSILYSINILNEGLHVKDVDAIFMLRKTTSPIIYFQQLGRLLSYSLKNKKVYVYDFVNNIGNHKAIYELYREVTEKAKQKMIINPTNKEKYQYIIDNFKIVDEYSEICKKLDDINHKLSFDSTINKRLDFDIKILKNPNNYNKSYNMQAIIDVFKYQNYITYDQFVTLKNIDFVKPSLFKYTNEEFKNILDGNNCVNDLTKINYNKIFENVMLFYDENKRVPSIYSNDKNEVLLANKLLLSYDYFTENKINKIKLMLTNDLSYIERVTYNYDLFDENYSLLYKQIDYMLENKIHVPQNIVLILDGKNCSENNMYKDKIFMNNNYYIKPSLSNFNIIDVKNDESKLHKMIPFRTNILFTEYAKKIDDIHNIYKNCENKKLYLKALAEELSEYIKVNHRFPSAKDDDCTLYLKYILFKNELINYIYDGDIKEMIEAFNLDIKESKRKMAVAGLMIFMKENNAPPCKIDAIYNTYIKYIDSLNEKEKQEYNEIMTINNKYKIISINDYVEFIKRKKRRPLLNSEDEKERNTAIRFERIRKILTPEEITYVNSFTSKLNSYKETKELYIEMKKKEGMSNGL